MNEEQKAAVKAFARIAKLLEALTPSARAKVLAMMKVLTEDKADA